MNWDKLFACIKLFYAPLNVAFCHKLVLRGFKCANKSVFHNELRPFVIDLGDFVPCFQQTAFYSFKVELVVLMLEILFDLLVRTQTFSYPLEVLDDHLNHVLLDGSLT